jgi:hypothetical protein
MTIIGPGHLETRHRVEAAQTAWSGSAGRVGLARRSGRSVRSGVPGAGQQSQPRRPRVPAVDHDRPGDDVVQGAALVAQASSAFRSSAPTASAITRSAMAWASASAGGASRPPTVRSGASGSTHPMTLRSDHPLAGSGEPNGGANAGRCQATPGDGPRRSVQLDGLSGDGQRQCATVRLRLNSGRSTVRSCP